MKREWRKRIRGTKAQMGKPFMLPSKSQQAMKNQLPQVKGKARLKYPTGKIVQYTIESAPIEQLSTSETMVTDPNPENFEARVKHFIDMYKHGETIPPILYHRMPDGRIKILDGRARLEAFRRLNVARIPAVENGILSSIKSGAMKIGSITKTGFQVGKMEAKNAFSAYRGKPLEGGADPAKSIGAKFGGGMRNVKVSGDSVVEAGKGVLGKMQLQGGGNAVMVRSPARRDHEVDNSPPQHRPCVITETRGGKVLKTYGILLDPRTHPLYMAKHEYTDVQ